MRRGILAVFAAMIAMGCADKVAPLQAGSEGPLWDAYRKSIERAAVKSDDAKRDLTPIAAHEDEVFVAHLQSTKPRDDNRDRTKIDTGKDDVWVSFPKELRAHCADKPDPLLALQMALGLPPLPDAEHYVFLFHVRRVDLFRPCASDSSVETSRCDLKVDISVNDPNRPFVLRQMMASYRGDGHPYPFTAMGWSYNWDPAAKTPMGVSEYIVRLNAPVMGEKRMRPDVFCAPGTPLG